MIGWELQNRLQLAPVVITLTLLMSLESEFFEYKALYQSLKLPRQPLTTLYQSQK